MAWSITFFSHDTNHICALSIIPIPEMFIQEGLVLIKVKIVEDVLD